MGNNKKTVKCSFCLRLGHNRVSCDKLKSMIENERHQYGSDHPDVKLYDKMTKGYSKKSSNNANNERHCKYCFQPNHNIRSCGEREKDFLALKKRNALWRKALLINLAERGIGTGCILSSKFSQRFGSRMYNKGDKWILTSINWDRITFDSSLNPEDYKAFKLVNLSNSSAQTALSVSQLVATVDNLKKEKEFYWEVVSPSKTLDFPEGWDTVSDKNYDKHLIEVFKTINKTTYQDLISFSYIDKPLDILALEEELYVESIKFSSKKED